MAKTSEAVLGTDWAHDHPREGAPSEATGRQAMNHTLHVSANNLVFKHKKRGSLVDRGANGGIIGSDARGTLQHQQRVDVTGIDNHELTALKMVDASAKVQSHRGEIIVILQQYAYH